MNDLLTIDDVKANVTYDAAIEMFRGEFIGLNGGADFYAKDIDGLKKEGAISLKVFLSMCQEEGVEPYKHYSGKFNLRINPDLHQQIAEKAKANDKSINVWVADKLEQAVNQ